MDGTSFAVCIRIAEFQRFVGCPLAGLKQRQQLAEDLRRVAKVDLLDDEDDVAGGVRLEIRNPGDLEPFCAKIIEEIGAGATKIARAGVNTLIDFLEAIGNGLWRVTRTATDLIIRFIAGLASNALRLANAAMDVLIDFLNGLADAIETKGPELRSRRNVKSSLWFVQHCCLNI